MRQAERTTLAAPRERRIIERPRLLEQLEGTTARTILLIAPAGYGKTTLARQWARAQGAAWFTATSASADVAALARGLAESLSKIDASLPRLVDETLRATDNPARDLTSLIEVFVRQLARSGEPWLVIDDYQTLEASPVAVQLIAAISEPHVLKLLVASRTRPRWVTTRHHVYGEIFELRRDALALNEHETAEVLADSLTDYPGSDELIVRAAGWPAAIGLVAVAGAPGTPPRETLPHTLYAFLAEESFSNAPSATQEALLSMALLPSLDNATLTATFGGKAQDLATEAARTGLADVSERGVELHPLARAFLFERLQQAPHTPKRVQRAIEHAIALGAWDEAFALIEAFQLDGMLEPLITASFRALLASGRVETLERFARYAITTRQVGAPLIDLIDGELAFRDGLLKQAQALAVSAAEALPPAHPLKARGYILGGTVALVRFDLHESRRLQSQALSHADAAEDRRDALWNQCLTLIYLEDHACREAARELTRISSALPDDRIRAATAQLLVSRLGGGLGDVGAAVAVDRVLHEVRNPRARTSFGNVCAYVLALQSQYDVAYRVIGAAVADAANHALSFARPHLLWTRAFVELGLRRFSQADSYLRAAEDVIDESHNAHLGLNARTLRARILLVQHRSEEAVAAASPDYDVTPSLAMYGENLATRALALAAAGRPSDALALLPTIRRMTSVVEVQTLVATAEAIAVGETEHRTAAAAQALALAMRLNTWDALVCGVRAYPHLLGNLMADRRQHRLLVAVLRRSHDESLLRASGLLSERSYRRGGSLSTREREVIDLLRQGLKNREIAQTLYISEATAKVHVRHILEKLGARSRAEAVARYALSADETGA